MPKTYYTKIVFGSNPGLREEKLANNSLGRGTEEDPLGKWPAWCTITLYKTFIII